MLKKIALATFVLFVFVTSVSLFLMINYPPLSQNALPSIAEQPSSTPPVVNSPSTNKKPSPSTPAPTPSPASTTPSYTLAQIATHNSGSSCWLIVNNQVYDVTSYLDQHPGGIQNITNNCGREVSQLFASIHSNRAWNLLGKYFVGNVTK